jgi:hypothetical protein
MDVVQYLEPAAKTAWADEIERAIADAKRTAEDKRFRREFYRSCARTGRGWGRRMGSGVTT